MFGVIVPDRGVGSDVRAHAFEIVTVADDAFVVVALPDAGTFGAADGVDATRRRGLEAGDERTE
jgi:hypothetical protein